MAGRLSNASSPDLGLAVEAAGRDQVVARGRGPSPLRLYHQVPPPPKHVVRRGAGGREERKERQLGAHRRGGQILGGGEPDLFALVDQLQPDDAVRAEPLAS